MSTVVSKEHEGDELMVAWISLKLHPDLKDLIDADAESKGLPTSELIVQWLADHYKRNDLGRVPRKSIGRPRTAKKTRD